MVILLKRIMMNEYILDFRTTTDNCTTDIINRYILVLLNTFFSLRVFKGNLYIFTLDKLSRLLEEDPSKRL